MPSWPRGPMLSFLALGLISCSAAGPTLPPAPPTVVEVPVTRWRSLPRECLEPLALVELRAGATNEDLARAYRDALDLVTTRAAVLNHCRALNAGMPPD